ncbi:c-type cytochrome [Sphingobacterium paucimobilis]|uniref:Cytochrome c domain-containing protein n=1 Tax=Sphingobacterium paucimobilis HER1398 TaxID=1346330 RepID=U2HG24_9SPHI|nr:c-type cytochrome [Sphingobacterium paucimobilis]ERJ60706.1 hypothetical protein M472_18265 [Sphingobacterium paucimobilis HER1398]
MEYKRLTNYVKALGGIALLSLVMCVCLFLFAYEQGRGNIASAKEVLDDSTIVHVADYVPITFKDDAEGKLAAYGEKLIKNTYDYFYEDGKKIGNNLACSNCHLNGGTKAFAAPYVGLHQVFPIYIGREDKVESLEERINGCFERSMNGRAIAENSNEMRAIITYIKQVSQRTHNDKRLDGQGFVKIEIPDRAADLKHGQVIYANQCSSCHGEQGQGQKNPNAGGYLYPPLWGADSYNDGAGMARMLTAARFIKGNMPLGATYDEPLLSDEEAYDVAAYINSFDRPKKANKEKDYPNLAKKPKDCAYPPYADDISAEQHKYGPFNF